MIEVLGEREVEDALRAFSRVFQGTTVMGTPFQPEIAGRMLFWPYGRFLTRQQVGALGPATGDDWAYVGGYLFNWKGVDDFHGWVRMDLADAASVYVRGPRWPDYLGYEHVIVGPRGDWGVLLPESGEAVFGASPQVVERFRRLAGIDEDEDVRETLAFWTEWRTKDFPASWIPDRLRHLYGPQRAAAWLAGTAFDAPGK